MENTEPTQTDGDTDGADIQDLQQTTYLKHFHLFLEYILFLGFAQTCTKFEVKI